MHGAPVVVLARDIRGQRDGCHARRGRHGGQVERGDAPVGNGAQAEGGMQGIRRERNIVAVLRPTADVQRRAVMGLRCAG